MVAADVQAAAERWIAIDPDVKTRGEIETLLAEGNEGRLRQLLLNGRMEFGTAGLRSCLGPGYTQMNMVTVAQTAQGLMRYIKSAFSAEDLASRGVLVGYDGRHNSRRFAEITANACVASGVRCRLTSTVVPTPYVSFGCRLFNCCAAVMVTASHNPATDNGYKVYWSNGSIIIPPLDTGIAASIEQSLELDPATLGDAFATSQLVSCPKAEIEAAYYESLARLMAHGKATAACTPLHFTYSAMHGVGGEAILQAVAVAGLASDHLHIVEQQFRPDPDFPTVTFPNPEEGKSALELSIETAAATGSTVILANDPDADRLAIVERGADGAWKVFTGDEIGALLGWWLIQDAKRRGVDLSKTLMLATCVSSQILASYARAYGCQYEVTLTGFKWLGSLGTKIAEERGLQLLFAFEDAIGFMCGDRARDKDGLTAAAYAVQMASSLKADGLSLADQLQRIHEEFGYHLTNNSYYVSRDTAAIHRMFKSIRDDAGQYPSSIGGVKVLHVRNLKADEAFDSHEEDKKPRLPTSASPQITFWLEGGVTLTLRTSGTEPKVKYYCEGIGRDRDETRRRVDAVVAGFVSDIMRPDEFGFQRRQ